MFKSVGIDISMKKVTVATDHEEFEEENTPQGHQRLIKRLRKGCRGVVRVCMEWTSVYSLDVALALHRVKNIEVMKLNPRNARRFAGILKRSKDDPIDARALLEYVRRMDFVPWCPPSEEKLQLRTFARRIATLIEMRTEEKNRLHAAKSTDMFDCVREDIKATIAHFDERIGCMRGRAGRLIAKHPRLQLAISRLLSVKGIADASALQIYGELCVLPQDMTARQWVAHAGLDPRHIESGMFKGTTRISKAGNKYLRAALYFPALSALTHQANVRAFYNKLRDKGKVKMQGVVAVMRKLLHAIWGMFKHGTDFDGEKFYALAQ